MTFIHTARFDIYVHVLVVEKINNKKLPVLGLTLVKNLDETKSASTHGWSKIEIHMICQMAWSKAILKLDTITQICILTFCPVN